MIKLGAGARKILGISDVPPRVPYMGTAPSYVVAKNGAEWGVAVLHGGHQVDWWTPAQARRHAMKILDLAKLASDPGGFPKFHCS
jgi:hypothetical protein